MLNYVIQINDSAVSRVKFININTLIQYVIQFLYQDRFPVFMIFG